MCRDQAALRKRAGQEWSVSFHSCTPPANYNSKGTDRRRFLRAVGDGEKRKIGSRERPRAIDAPTFRGFLSRRCTRTACIATRIGTRLMRYCRNSGLRWLRTVTRARRRVPESRNCCFYSRTGLWTWNDDPSIAGLWTQRLESSNPFAEDGGYVSQESRRS